MGKFDALLKVLGVAAKEVGDDAAKVLSKVETPEVAVALKGKAREQYLDALTQVHGDKAKRASDMGFGDRTWYHGTTVPIDKFEKQALGLSTGAQSAKKGYFFASDAKTASDYAELAKDKGVIREGDKVTTRYLSNEAPTLEKEFTEYRDLKFDVEWGEKSLNSLKNEAQGLANRKARLGSDPEFLSYINEEISKNKKAMERVVGELSQKKDKLKKLDDVIESQGQNVLPVRLKGSRDNIHLKNYKGESYRDSTYADEMSKAQKEGKKAVLFKNTFDPADPNYRVKQDIAAVFEPNQVRSEFAAFDPRFKDSPLLMAGGIAGVGAKQPVDMSPLPYLKSGVNLYNKAKEAVIDPLANQLDFTSDKSFKDTAKGFLNVAADPLNLIPGPLGVGAAALSMAGELSPEEKANRDALNKLAGY